MASSPNYEISPFACGDPACFLFQLCQYPKETYSSAILRRLPISVITCILKRERRAQVPPKENPNP